MLQNSKTPDATTYPQLEGGGSGGLHEIVAFAIGFLLRQWQIVAFATALGLAAGIIYLKITPPIFNATATVLIDRQKSAFFQQQGLLSDAPVDSAAVESQLEILRSKAIASGVIKHLQLDSDSEFVGSGSGYLRTLLPGAKPNSILPIPNELLSRATRSSMRSKKGSRSTGLASVGCSKSASVPASRIGPAQIANAVANAYVTDQLEAKYQANRAATEWLQGRLQQSGEQSAAAQRAVEAFKEQNHIITAEGKPVDEQKVVDLNSRLVAARTQTSDTLARLNRLQAIIKTGSAEFDTRRRGFRNRQHPNYHDAAPAVS